VYYFWIKSGEKCPSIMKKPKQEITMKTLITTILLFVFTTTAYADGDRCTNTDLAIGVGVGVTAGVAVGVGTVAASPLIGAGVAAGSTVGWLGALSAPILAGSTAMSVAFSTAIIGPLAGITGYYTSCVVNAVWLDE
jgi:hypothetical protein